MVGFSGGAGSHFPISWGLWSAVGLNSLAGSGVGFWSILGPQKSRQKNGQLAFESEGGNNCQQVNLGVTFECKRASMADVFDTCVIIDVFA